MKNVLFVLSMYHGDAAAALALTKWMLEIGTLKNGDKALVVTTKKATHLPEVGQVIYNLQKIFGGGVEHYGLVAEDERGPWFSNNFMFRSVAQYVEHKRKDVDAFYFFEPDCTPTVPEWWNKIRAEYDSCGMPFMGDVRTVNHLTDSDMHMNGSGVYPQNVAKYSVLALRADSQPWDTFARHEIIPHAHGTRLITTLFNTIDYREVDGKIVTKLGYNGIQNSGPDVGVDPKAVVVHGCKDGSFGAILRKRRLAAARHNPLPETEGSLEDQARKHDLSVTIDTVAKGKKGLSKSDLTPEEERQVKGLVTTLELFCGNDRRTAKVRSLIKKSAILVGA